MNTKSHGLKLFFPVWGSHQDSESQEGMLLDVLLTLHLKHAFPLFLPGPPPFSL